MPNEKETYRKLFKQIIDGDAPYTIDHFEAKRKEQQARADRGEPTPVGEIELNEASLVAAYATFYAAEDLKKSSERLNVLTCVLIVLTVVLAVLTFFLVAR